MKSGLVCKTVYMYLASHKFSEYFFFFFVLVYKHGADF